MAEQKEQKSVFELSKQLRDILDGVLSIGDWKSSLFLKTAATKLQDLREKSDKLFRSGTVSVEDANASKNYVRQAAPPGYSQVFILLYQVDGANLQGWYRTVKTLSDYNVTRPVYKEEDHVKEFIRSKTATPDRNGYAVVNIKDSDFYQTEQQADQFGHPLFILKEGAVKLENVIEFIHSNRKCYAVHEDEMVFLNEI